MTRMLIVKPSSLGDILHAFPAVSLLAQRIPDLKVDWFVHPAFAGLLDYMPCVDRKILFKRKELGSFSGFVPSMLDLLKELRKEEYDAIIDFQGLLRSAAIAFLGRGKILVGPDSPKEGVSKLFYGKRIKTPAKILHAADRNTSMACEFLGIPFESHEAKLPVNERNMEKVGNAFQKICGAIPKPLVGIIPGARWDTKRWPPEFFANLIKAMAKARPELTFVVFGASSDVAMAAEIGVLTKGDASVFDMTGRTSIGELVEALRLCSVVISNDSGPMHVAAAAGSPLVALFGPTQPQLTGPHSKKAKVLTPDIDCIGCMKHYCEKGLCHVSLAPETAAQAALELLCWRN